MKNKINIVISVGILVLCIVNLILVLNVKERIPNDYYAKDIYFTYDENENRFTLSFELYSNNNTKTRLNPNDRVLFKCHTNDPNWSYYVEAVKKEGNSYGLYQMETYVEQPAYHSGYKDVTYCDFVAVMEISKIENQ